MSKRNLKDDFEAIYLRYNMVKKHISEADPTILQDLQFKKCITHMTTSYFRRYHDLFVSNGFGFDDLQNIITVFGLTYWGHSKPEARDRKAFMFMMRYIGQRLSKLVYWITRKFGVDEVNVISTEHAGVLHDKGIYQEYLAAEPQADLESTIADTEDEIDFSLEYEGDESPTVDRLSQDLKEMKADRRAASKERREITARLKAEFLKDPKKHSDILCHYATSKHVSREVRSKAKLICKRYGIDYITWAKNKAAVTDYDHSHFTL